MSRSPPIPPHALHIPPRLYVYPHRLWCVISHDDQSQSTPLSALYLLPPSPPGVRTSSCVFPISDAASAPMKSSSRKGVKDSAVNMPHLEVRERGSERL